MCEDEGWRIFWREDNVGISVDLKNADVKDGFKESLLVIQKEWKK
jgi:hypothetical protein